MDHFPTVGHLKCTVKAVYIKSFEAKRGVRANPLEPPPPPPCLRAWLIYDFSFFVPVNFSSKYEHRARCELRCHKVYQSTGVEVHLVIARGYIMKRQRTLFESFDCEEESANKRSNRDGRETQHNTNSVNQPHGPTTVVVNRCPKFPNLVPELSSLREVSSSTDKGPCDLAPSPNHPPCQPVVRYPTTELGGKQRSFNSEWYRSYSWLEYSVERDACFCYPCCLFTTGEGRSHNTFTEVGFRDWKHATLHRVQQVGVLGELSSPTAVISGVPQGSVLGPLLFLIYIDGLSGIQLSGGSIVLFADDLLLHHLITCLEDSKHVQNDIDELCNWLSSNKLSLNTNKCKSLLISKKRFPTVSPTLHVNGSVLERVSSYRYLGVLISSDLSWSNHIKDISSKARKQVGLLYRRFYKHAAPATLRTLYTALIRPHLEYAVPVWDPHLCKDIDALESVQRFATKICTKSWNTNYQYRLGKLRLQTLNMRRCYLKLCHLYKLVHSLSIFPNSPVTTSSSHSYPTRSNHNLSLHVPSCHTNAYYYSFFVMPYVPGTHYLTLLHHYLALIYLKRLCLIIYSYCCACTVLFYFWVHTRISTIVAIYVSHVFWHKLLYTKKKKKNWQGGDSYYS